MTIIFKPHISILTFVAFTTFCSCVQKRIKSPDGYTGSRNGLTGNNIAAFVQDKEDKQLFTDPIDDTINFKKVVDNIYKGHSDKIYILNVCGRPMGKDTFLYSEYYKEVTDFLDLKSYGQIKNGYFQNKGKVYIWWSNSDGDYPIEVTGADAKTFTPFDSVAGGTDKQHVFYGGVPDQFQIISGADPKSIKVLNPERGCWNCGDCYFVDDKNVFYGLTKIKGADPRTFKLVNKKVVDAEDKNGKYFEGKSIR